MSPGAGEIRSLSMLFAAGKFADAASSARDLTRRFPQSPVGWIVLGVALSQMGRNEDALRPMQKAVELSPGDADANSNLGNTLQILGRLEEAEVSCRRALQIKPDFAEAHNNLGNTLRNLGRLDEAEASYRSALRVKPDFAEAHNNLGNALRESGKLIEAEENYQRALRLRPNFADARYNLANVLRDQGRLSLAEENYRHALQLRPNFADAHYNLANALRDMGRSGEAEENYRRALQIRPDFAEGYNNFGNLLKDSEQLDEAIVCYRRALQINPNLSEVQINLGNALKDQGNLEEAEASYRRAIEINPRSTEARVSLVMLSLILAPTTIDEARAVVWNFDQELDDFAKWLTSQPKISAAMLVGICSQQPFHLAYRSGNHVGSLSRYGDLVERCADSGLTSTPKPAGERLKLVIITRYFCKHPVWYIILRGILEHIDRAKFELVLYQLGYDRDEETEHARSLADFWRDGRSVVGLKGWLGALAEDKADIILYPSIGMDPVTLQLAAHRLAALQVASWGHPITTGLPTIDLYLSGEKLEPADADSHYRERLVRLPGTGCCTTPIEVTPGDLGEIEAELLSKKGTRFVIAQTPYKFDPADDALIARIAASLPESVFVLLRPNKVQWASDIVVARLSRAFREQGLVPEQHLYVIPWLSQEKFHRLLELCDIYLDCPSFSGYTTAWQAIHRGIPIVTLEGQSMRQRLAAGLLRQLGLNDTIATSKDDYVDISVRLAEECRDPERRGIRRQSIISAVPRMDNDISVVRALEKVLIDAHAGALLGRCFQSTVANG
ncbi:MAG: tetratricopeptide repeat protein [Gallionella sp.]